MLGNRVTYFGDIYESVSVRSCFSCKAIMEICIIRNYFCLSVECAYSHIVDAV